MQQASTAKSPTEGSPPAPSDRKRKLSGQAPYPQSSTARNATNLGKQPTLSELVPISQQNPTSRDSNDTFLSPASKRAKTNGIGSLLQPDEFPSSPPQASPETISPKKMYSFTSKNNAKGGVIDLTSSPAASPPRKNGFVRNGARSNFNPHAGAKRIVVRNFKKQSDAEPRKYFEQVWQKLSVALEQIFKHEKIGFSLEELYKCVENVCKQGHAEELSDKLVKRCEAYMKDTVHAKLVTKSEESNVNVLKAVLDAWRTWTAHMKQIYWIWCYMDRSFLLRKGQSLQEISHDIFRSNVFRSPSLQPKIIDGACELVASDRDGEMDSDTFREAVDMFHEIGTYTDSFEPRLLEQSQSYVIAWAERASAGKELADYVRSSLQLIENERERCESFNLDVSTRRSLMTLLEDYLISRQEKKLVGKNDVADLLDLNAVEDLKQLFAFLQKRSLGEKLRPAFVDWIDLTGTSIVFDEKEQDQMVVKLLSLKQQLDAIWKVSFQRNDELGHSLRKVFETFINKSRKASSTWNTDNSKPEEMIAKYLDLLLRGGAKAIPAVLSKSTVKADGLEEDDEEDVIDEDTVVNNQLDQVLDLFRFVHGKAVFEAFYKKDLARRLLLGRSASADAERNMLSRLKTECGAGFTNNLEQMFKDIELAREEMSSYKSLLEERDGKRPALDLSVNILSASAWPTYPEIPVIIPMEIKNAIDKYEEHYQRRHSGRKLEWRHALAHCQLKAAFPKGNKEFVVSSFQAVVLLLFNGRALDERVTYEFLKEETGLSSPELNRTLQSLACARLRPLTKYPKGREINETDEFSLNANFQDPKYRVKINTVQLKETAQENKETHERVHADRHLECQAAIVRILKSRKRITHQELIAETIAATRKRGAMAVPDIKKNLDRLIEKEYCEREEGNWYSYIA